MKVSPIPQTHTHNVCSGITSIFASYKMSFLIIIFLLLRPTAMHAVNTRTT